MKSPQAITIAENIKVQLTSKGMRQIDLARKAKIGKSTCCDYLNGSVPRSLKNIAKIANALDITLDELVFERRSES